jgi:RimJ/RimL family protein N-acetyltransferase
MNPLNRQQGAVEMFDHDLFFRQVVTLRDGTRILLRPLAKTDRQPLIDLYSTVSPEERLLMRHDVCNPNVVGSWADEINYNQVLPIIAVLGARIVGNSSLHFFEGHKRHVGEIRIYLDNTFRMRGLGTRMLQSVIELARKRGLYLLEVQMVSDQSHYIKAFQNAGFVQKFNLEDYFMQPNGDLRDICLLMIRLRPSDEEF